MALMFLATLIVSPVLAVTADQLVARNLKARGGIEKIKAVNSMRMTGRVTLAGREGTVTLLVKRPHRLRMDQYFPGGSFVQGFDGEHGWLVATPGGSQALPDEQNRDLRDQSDFDGPFVDYKKKGNTLTVVGTVKIEGVDAYEVEVSDSSGSVSRIYIDTDSYLEIREEERSSTDGVEIEGQIGLGDYRKVSGLMVAHSMEFKVKDSPVVVTIALDKVELNADLPDSLFAMPAGIKSAPVPADTAGSATHR